MFVCNIQVSYVYVYMYVIDVCIYFYFTVHVRFQMRTGEGAWYNIAIKNISVETLFIAGTDWWGAGEGALLFP